MQKFLSLFLVSAIAATGAACKKAPAGEPPVARVNNEDVSRDDFNRMLTDIEIRNGSPIPPERQKDIHKQIVDELVTYTVLKQAAAKQQSTVTDAEVDQRIEALRKSEGSEENFQKALAERKMTLERLKSDTRIQVAIAKMIEEQVSKAPEASDDEAKAFYEKNPDTFKKPETVRASHILIKVDAAAKPEEKAAAKTKIDQLLKRAKAGEDFAALARENSQDGSASRGGDLGFFPREQMVKPFSDVAFALKPGQVSDVVTTQFGYHIIKVSNHESAGTVSYEEAGPRLKAFLSQKNRQQQTQAYIAELRQKSKIEVFN